MLRRKKGEVSLLLPEKTLNLVRCPFDPAEQAAYDAFDMDVKERMAKLREENQVTTMNALVQLLRLRQGERVFLPAAIRSRSAHKSSACNHPMLVTSGVDENASDASEDASTVNDIPTSPKTRHVIELLKAIAEESPSEKTIVFSQFTSMLSLLEHFLRAEKVPYLRCEFSERAVRSSC